LSQPETPDTNVVLALVQRKYPNVTESRNPVPMYSGFQSIATLILSPYPVLKGRQGKIGPAGGRRLGDPCCIDDDVIGREITLLFSSF
jgi:hypothetical protein